jgi:hypothetical protein
MGRINVVPSDDVERKLRVAIAQEGGKKGDLSESIEEAILAWLKRNDRDAKGSR